MRIILADHHAHTLWALKTTLGEEPEFDLIGDAVDGQGLLILAREHKPDLVLVDKSLPGIPIEDLISSLHTQQPRPIVIVMSSEFEYSRVLLKAGADAFVSKGYEPGWLLEKLHMYAKQINMVEDANKDKRD